MPEDGFSLYRCLAEALSPRHYRDLWSEAVERVCSEWAHYGTFATDQAGSVFLTPDEYRSNSEAFRSWRDRLVEVQAVCDLYRLKIVIQTLNSAACVGRDMCFESQRGRYEKLLHLREGPASELTPLPHVDRSDQSAGSLVEVRITGDGNCLYRAISRAVYDTEKNHAKVRKSIVDHVSENWGTLKWFACDGNGRTYKSFNHYKHVNSSCGSFGGTLEISAASKVFSRNITLHSAPDVIHFLVENPADPEPIHLLHQGSKSGGHFNLLVTPERITSCAPKRNSESVSERKGSKKLKVSDEKELPVDGRRFYSLSSAPSTKTCKVQQPSPSSFGKLPIGPFHHNSACGVSPEALNMEAAKNSPTCLFTRAVPADHLDGELKMQQEQNRSDHFEQQRHLKSFQSHDQNALKQQRQHRGKLGSQHRGTALQQDDTQPDGDKGALEKEGRHKETKEGLEESQRSEEEWRLQQEDHGNKKHVASNRGGQQKKSYFRFQ